MKVKIFVIIVLLFLIYISNISSQTPVKYNLKQGQVFHYSIESRYPNSGPAHTSFGLYFNFKVLAVDKSSYRIQLLFDKVYVSDENAYYDSQSGLPPFGNIPQYYGYLVEKPVIFSMLKDSTEFNVEGIGALVDSIAKAYYKTSFKEKTQIRQFLRNEMINLAIYLVLAQEKENAKEKAFNKLFKTAKNSYADKNSNSRKQYASHASMIINQSSCSIMRIKLNQKKARHSFIVDAYIDKRSYRRDHVSGLPVNVQIINGVRQYEKIGMLSDFEDSIQINIRQLKNFEVSKKATIYGQITNLKSAVKINTQGSEDILFQNFNPDYKVFDVDSLTNIDGTFSFTCELRRPVEIEFWTPNKPIHSFIIKPGDSIYINASYSNWDKTWKISGKGSEITTLIEQAKKNIHKLPSSYLDWEKNLQVDEEERYIIDPYWKPYNLRPETIDSLNNLNSEVLKYVRTQIDLPFLLDNSDNVFSLYDQAWIKEIFEKFEKKGYSLLSFRFKRYLLRLLRNNYIKNTDYNSELNSPQKQYYFLKYNAPRTEICYYLMANAVYRAVRSLKVNEAKELLVDFKRTFPESEYALSLQNLISQKVDLSPGSVAPDFTLPNVDGKKISLSNLKDKWVLLFINSDDLEYSLDKEVEIARKVKKKVPAGKFEVLWVMTGEKKENIDTVIMKCSSLGVVLFDPGLHSKSIQKYKDPWHFQMHILSPGNIIEGNVGISLDDNLIQQLIETITTSESKQNTSSKTVKALLWAFSIGIVFSIIIFFIYRRRMKVLHAREARQREKLDLELKAIRSQLNPHFMFNSLSSIQHLVNDSRIDDANQYLSSFANLMRKVLHQSDKELVPLENELDTLRQYLELEALRFNFKFKIDVATDIDIFNTEIPPMLLQPFVENAVIHGIAAMNGNGEILVNVGKNENLIKIVIEDNGTGISMSKVEDGNVGNGKGLSLTRKRMDLIRKGFGNNMKFDITDLTNEGKQGTKVEISFESE